MYFCPIANGQKILKGLSSHIVHKLPGYQDILSKTDYVFEQYSGAVITNACFLIALERCTNSSLAGHDSDEDRGYFIQLLNPIERLFNISGGRPNIEVRVKFNVGNTSNPAFGYLPGIDQGDRTVPQDNSNSINSNSLYGGFLSAGPPVQAHHVIVHEPKEKNEHFSPSLVIRAKSFPSSNTGGGEDSNVIGRLSTGIEYTADPLVEVIDNMKRPKAMLAERQRQGTPPVEDVLSSVINTQLYCDVKVYNKNFTEMSVLQKYIKIDPLPFLVSVILRNSAV